MLCRVSMRPGSPTGSRRMVVRSLVIALGLLAAAALYMSGGFDRIPPPQRPTVQPGTVDRAEPWNVTVTAVQVTNGPAKPSEPGNRWIEVHATVEVTADRSDDVFISDAVSVSGIDGLVDDNPDVRLVRDGTHIIYLHPGLPERVVFSWEQSGDAMVPKEIEVAITGMTRRRDLVTGLMQWKDPVVRARVRLPVGGGAT
jgi:hypothetical protein